MEELKNGKAAGKDEMTEEIIKGGELDQCGIKSGFVLEDSRSAVNVPLCKGKGERALNAIIIEVLAS